MKKIVFAIISFAFIFASCGKNSGGFASKSTAQELAMDATEEVLYEADLFD